MTRSATEKIHGRTGLRPPVTLTLAITGACNLNCLHCWVEAGVDSSAEHVPTETLRRLTGEFAALGGEGIRFTGGEPLCHPGWLELVRYARGIGFKNVSLQTNGILFTDDHVAALRELDFPGLTIQVSLDGATAPTHDLVRGKGAFAGALAGIRRLAEGGLSRRISLFFTEMSHNLEEIPAVLELADALGIAAVATGGLVLCGRAAEGSPLAPPAPERYAILLRRFDTDPRFRELYERIGKVAALEWRKGGTPREECCTFVENPYITSGGRLYPCVLCHAEEFSVSGVFGKSLAAAFAEGAPLWEKLLRISQSRAAALTECRDCPECPACAGGCMGRAWGSRGDLLATDDRCELRRTVGRQKKASHS